MHSLAFPDQWRHLIAAQMEWEVELKKKRKNYMDTKSENLLLFLTKVENQMQKKGKSTNCNEHLNQNNLSCLDRDLKKSQNRKTENPSTPLPKLSDGL